MIRQLEAKYEIFDRIEDLLAPDTLSALLSKPITQVELLPMDEHGGLGGGHLSYVVTNAGRYVLKRMSIETDYVMASSRDTVGRSVTLWQYGLLDRLLPHVAHKMIACARDGAGWALLMEDLTGSTFAWDKQPMPPALLPVYLDAMARIHATFWNDPCLRSPELGIARQEQILDVAVWRSVGEDARYSASPLPEWFKSGWAALGELLDDEVYRHLSRLCDDSQPVIDAARRFPTTLIHGDYREANFAYVEPGVPVVFDWQQAGCALMTIDLAWILMRNRSVVEAGMGREAAIRYYRERLETYLGTPFEDSDWQIMVDLGCLIDTMRLGWIGAHFYKVDDSPDSRKHNGDTLRMHSQQVRDGLRWL